MRNFVCILPQITSYLWGERPFYDKALEATRFFIKPLESKVTFLKRI